MNKLTDPTLINNLDATLVAAIESNLDVRRDWLGQNGRVAVLIPNSAHLSNEQAGHIASAMRSCGYAHAFGADVEDIPNIENRWQVAATADDLLAFSNETAVVSCALTPADGSFIVLCTFDDYCILAGSQDFVKQACGGDIDAARVAFREYIFEISESPEAWLQTFAARYGC